MSIPLLLSLLAAAPATKPAEAPSALEVRANTAFNKGDYVAALTAYRKLQMHYEGQPDKLGAIEEKVRVCQAQIVVGGARATTAPATGERKAHPAPKAGQTLELTIKDLGNFDFDADKGGNIPADVKALSGSTVKIHGFMIPIDQAENITQFALVPDLFACCFGQPPQVQHTIVCKSPPGKSVGYYPDELIVEGKLKVEEKKDEGFIISLFEIEVTSVKPAAK